MKISHMHTLNIKSIIISSAKFLCYIKLRKSVLSCFSGFFTYRHFLRGKSSGIYRKFYDFMLDATRLLSVYIFLKIFPLCLKDILITVFVIIMLINIFFTLLFRIWKRIFILEFFFLFCIY